METTQSFEVLMKDWIGFLDSGVGGISVLKTAVEWMPN